MDIAAAAAARVGAQQVAQAIPPRGQPPAFDRAESPRGCAAPAAAARPGRGIDPAGAVGFAEADIAGAQDGAAGTPVRMRNCALGGWRKSPKVSVVPCGVISSR
jgi:hypothetical protein